MIWTILFVLFSFFAIIGLMEFVMCIMETVSMRTTRSIEDIRIVVDIKGCEPHIEFLLSTLSIMADRIAFKDITTKVCIRNLGTDQTTYQRLKEYIEENPNIKLIEKDG